MIILLLYFGIWNSHLIMFLRENNYHARFISVRIDIYLIKSPIWNISSLRKSLPSYFSGCQVRTVITG